jgi:hypothetical protein
LIGAKVEEKGRAMAVITSSPSLRHAGDTHHRKARSDTLNRFQLICPTTGKSVPDAPGAGLLLRHCAGKLLARKN